MRITIGTRIGRLAAEHPDRTAVVSVDARGNRSALTWAELDHQTNLAADGLAALGVTAASTVPIALPAGLGHLRATLGAWKLGALVIPIDPAATPRERAAFASTVGDHFLVDSTAWYDDAQPLASPRSGDDPGPLASARSGDDARPVAASRSTGVGTPRSASLTGGTTGLPRVILRAKPWVYDEGEFLSASDTARGVRPGQVQLVVLPMYHAGFTALYQGLVLDHLLVIMERFVPSLWPKLVAEYGVQHIRIVPAYLRMLLDVPGLADYDLSSIESLHHGAGPCPEHLKRRWIELLGPEKIIEDYASQERIGSVIIRGDEWLEHPGSVGRPADGQVRILDDHGEPVAKGTIGQIYFRGTSRPQYVGAGPELAEHDGYLSVGDLGRLDSDGYLYLVDRLSSVLNVGGQNVYPAEIEAVLSAHPGVADVAVTGVPHDYLGQSVHALIVPTDPDDPVNPTELETYSRTHLTAGKAPLSYAIVQELPRRTSGKLRRDRLSGIDR
ncbi:AMP-binding protein [Kribbella sp. NPDC006257]|uniref:AMP-binding protein n=1 Tax=Kribbella sp. NPDC006257 TaxID=3156738 RepID=UPI0033BBE7B4